VERKRNCFFEVVWNDTQFSKKSMMHKITPEQVQRGISNRQRLLKDHIPGENRIELSKIDPVPNMTFDVSDEADWYVVDNSCERFIVQPCTVNSLEEVEKITSLNFTTHGYIKEPQDLYPDMGPKLKDEYKERFLCFVGIFCVLADIVLEMCCRQYQYTYSE
jgi:hypothetical protein